MNSTKNTSIPYIKISVQIANPRAKRMQHPKLETPKGSQKSIIRIQPGPELQRLDISKL